MGRVRLKGTDIRIKRGTDMGIKCGTDKGIGGTRVGIKNNHKTFLLFNINQLHWNHLFKMQNQA